MLLLNWDLTKSNCCAAVNVTINYAISILNRWWSVCNSLTIEQEFSSLCLANKIEENEQDSRAWVYLYTRDMYFEIVLICSKCSLFMNGGFPFHTPHQNDETTGVKDDKCDWRCMSEASGVWWERPACVWYAPSFGMIHSTAQPMSWPVVSPVDFTRRHELVHQL